MFNLFHRNRTPEAPAPVRYPDISGANAYTDRRPKRQPARREYIAPVGTPDPLYVSMLHQNHLLIAGMSGSGKSVIINGMIYAALHQTPRECRFILLDPKRVELCIYRNLPHTLRYAIEAGDMIHALEYALDLIEERYRSMQAAGKRKYTGAHIYVIIDEMADLMTTCKKRVTPLLQRIAQIGRAAAVSLVGATQCPLASILPTPIKCNIDSRIALHTRTRQDSRNIMDDAGAETLPRYGKAYYLTPEKTQIVTVPMVSDDDINDIVSYWMQYK